METLYFVLGMLSVVTLVAVGGVVMTANKMRSLKREMKDEVRDIIGNEIGEMYTAFAKSEDYWGREIDRIESLIDSKDDNIHKYADQLHNNLYDEMNKLYSYVDSRTDKMADGFSKHIADINRQIMSGDQWALYNEGPTKD